MANYQVRADIYPATFETTDAEGNKEVYDKVRVVLTLDTVYVFQDAHPVPEVVFEDRLVSYTPPVPSTRVRSAAQLYNRFAALETADGVTATFQKQSGCGCGSRLKTMRLDQLMPEGSSVAAASKNDK